MKIAALDIAGVTGVAVGSPGGTPTYWSVDLGKRLSEEQRFSKALTLTGRLIQSEEPDLIAIEAAVGGPMTSHFLVGLVACVRGAACLYGVDVEMFHTGSIRKHFVGKALTTRDFPSMSKAHAKRAIKGEIIKRCQLLGWNPQDDNAADALALLDFALATKTNHQSRVAGGLV